MQQFFNKPSWDRVMGKLLYDRKFVIHIMSIVQSSVKMLQFVL